MGFSNGDFLWEVEVNTDLCIDIAEQNMKEVKNQNKGFVLKNINKQLSQYSVV
jgi:hypothetical protein